MQSQKEIIIVGGGIIGLCSAYYLNQAGHKVTIIDKTDMENSCSVGNAGMIVPSHFIPLAAPGMISKGIKWMFNSESPFYVKPRLSMDLISWGMKFYKAATAKQVESAMPALRDISLLSRKLFVDLSLEPELDFGFECKGLLMLCKTAQGLQEETHVAQLANQLGIAAKILSKDEVYKYEPELQPEVSGGVFYPGDAHCYPNSLVKNLAGLLKSRGIKIFSHTVVTGFNIKNNDVNAVITNAEKLKADEVIIAGGSWSPQIVRSLQLNIPLQAGKGYSITFDHPPVKLNHPSILCEARVAITPMREKLRIGGTMEIAGINADINMKRVRGIINSVPEYFPSFKIPMPAQSQVWSGLRPCSPDGLPYIGRSNKYKNLVIATGHAMMGLSLGPATGFLVKELVNNENPSTNIDLFSANRYH